MAGAGVSTGGAGSGLAVEAVCSGFWGTSGTGEGIAASTYFTPVRFGRWDEVLAQPAPEPRFKYLTGIRHWARGVAYAAKGQLREAGTEQKALDTIRAHLGVGQQRNEGTHAVTPLIDAR